MKKNKFIFLCSVLISQAVFGFDYMGTYQSIGKFDYVANDGKKYKCQIQSVTFDETTIDEKHILRISPAELICDSLHPNGNPFTSTLPGHTFLVEFAFPECKSKYLFEDVDMDPLKSCLEFYPYDIEKNKRSGTGRGVAKNKSLKFLTSRTTSILDYEMSIINLTPDPYEFFYSNCTYFKESEGLGVKTTISKGFVDVPLIRISE